MATTITDAADIIAKYWLNEAIVRFRKEILMARLCRRDYSETTASLGDTISIPKRGSVTVRDKAPGTDITTDSPSNTKVDVVIDTHKYVSWGAEDHTIAKAMPVGLQYLDDAMPQLAEAVELDLLNLYSECALSAGTQGTPLDEDTILSARQQLNEQNAPMTNRYMVVGPADEANLLKIDRFTRYDARGGNEDRIAEGSLGRLHGFNTFMSTMVPVTGGPQSNGLAFHPDAFVVVSRMLPQPEQGMGVISAAMADPISGLVFRYTRGYDIKAQAMINTIDILYGVKAIDEDRLAVHLIS